MVKSGYSRILLIVFIFIFSLLPTTTAFAQGQDTIDQRIYDHAGLLSENDIQELEILAKKYSDERETNFVIVTEDDPKPNDVAEYTEDFYDEKLPGYDKPAGNAVILTLDMKNREVYLAGFYKGEKYLGSHRLDLIREKITPFLSDGDYFHAFKEFILTGHAYMGYWTGIEPDSFFFSWWFQIGVPLVLAAIVLFAMLYSSGGRVTVNSATYIDNQHSKVRKHHDIYLRKTVDRRRKPKNNSNNRGGFGGGGITRGGHSHSGSRGSF
ncbi:TPM domain-containing protein [Virgibacillus sp. 179-BFC.A HS]|uniref:TPM domain-containing protein n=1 Tax=Tigheibacillus jepli TaxID=3035914 RepID=A0ABU5CL58_9BACI|nr:TPM domain-containing protein [Virgibacillus sp. 179-BFC.A HS]MDY0406572.1 TPM domain-containing protein [Virgibacillus sp. 179-BFC.A HS]